MQLLLIGEAARVIQGLPMSESNYKRAFDLLKECFGQKQVLINAHMDALLKITVTNNDVRKLRSLYDTCKGYKHPGLESLDVYSESYGDLFIPIVMKKLPGVLCCEVMMTMWTLADLREQLRLGLEIRESSLAQSDKKVSVPNPPFNSKFPTAGALFSGALGRGSAKDDFMFCDGSHPLYKVAPKIEVRLEFLCKQKRCLRYFKKGHRSKYCYSKKCCSWCNENIIWRRVNPLQLTGINLLQWI